MLLRDKVVLITGGSSGIGKATALLFAQNGADVCFSYKENKSGAEETLKELEELGVGVLSIQADLTSDEQARNLVEKTLEHFGHIDILVNNAGRYIAGDEWDGEYGVWEKSLQQSLLSIMSVSKYVIKEFQKQSSGVIVNVSSRYSVSGQEEAIAYAAAKAGVVNLTQAYAKLLAPWGRANVVSPGAVRAGYWLTAPQEELDENIKDTLLEKIVEPEEIAETIFFLASDKSKMITGQNIIVDAGSTVK